MDKMPITVTALVPGDIPGAVTAIQEAFKGDPYSEWVYTDQSKVSLQFNYGLIARGIIPCTDIVVFLNSPLLDILK
jgi:hypothetical protein